MDEASRPPTWRIVAAFLLAPLGAACVLAYFFPAAHGVPWAESIVRTTFIYGVFGAYPLTIVFGTPLFLILRNRVRATPVSCAVSGSVVVLVPALLLLAFHPASKDGSWLEAAAILSGAAGLGLVAGLLFWFIAAAGWGGKRALR
jgi:hypothetical protein